MHCESDARTWCNRCQNAMSSVGACLVALSVTTLNYILVTLELGHIEYVIRLLREGKQSVPGGELFNMTLSWNDFHLPEV